MKQSLNMPLDARSAADWGGWAALAADCAGLGLDGVEGIWSGVDIPADFPKDLLVGYHLTFFPDWLDFFREDRRALTEKFGSVAAAKAAYGMEGPGDLVDLYRQDLARAAALGARYVVFHVSDVSMEEGFTYRWRHTDDEVIDGCARLVNALADSLAPGMEFLMENQWWPGFRFTDPVVTARMLEAVKLPGAGIMLDTGHLMNTNPALKSEEEGAAYIAEMLRRHGSLCRYIRGMHLHQSLSGDFVRAHVGHMPDWLDTVGEEERFARCYAHIQSIDRHQPWHSPAIAPVVEAIAPAYLTHELSAQGREAKLAAVRTQLHALRAGACAGERNKL